MSGETRLTIVGRLTAAPELRFTASGVAVANFTIASNARKFDRQTQEWKDEPPLFMRCSIWREAAENVAESLDKGMAVIAVGVLTQRSFETQSGEKRTVMELQVEEVGPSMRYVTARVERRVKSGGFGQQGGFSQSGGYAPAGGADDDPWASGTGMSGSMSDEPSF